MAKTGQTRFYYSPSELQKNIPALLSVGKVPFIRSSPGLGKTSILEAITRELNLKQIDVNASSAESGDFNGLPGYNATNTGAIYLPFDTFPLEGDPLPKDEEGKDMETILCLGIGCGVR